MCLSFQRKHTRSSEHKKRFKYVCLIVRCCRYVDPMLRQIYWTDFVIIFATLVLKDGKKFKNSFKNSNPFRPKILYFFKSSSAYLKKPGCGSQFKDIIPKSGFEVQIYYTAMRIFKQKRWKSVKYRMNRLLLIGLYCLQGIPTKRKTSPLRRLDYLYPLQLGREVPHSHL